MSRFCTIAAFAVAALSVASAHALEVIQGSAGKRILDEKGKDVLLRLEQFPLSHTVIDLIPVIGPKYTVTVYSDCTVTFLGVSMVKTIGLASHKLTGRQCEELTRKLSTLKALDLKSSNPSLSYAKLTFAVAGDVHAVDFDTSNSQRYSALRSSLEEYLKTKTYRCPLQDSNHPIAIDGLCENVFEFEKLFSKIGKE